MEDFLEILKLIGAGAVGISLLIAITIAVMYGVPKLLEIYLS